MRKILTRQETEVVLEPHYSKITDAISNGFGDYLKVLANLNAEGKRVVFKKGTIAGMIHDFIKARIKDAFTENDNVETKEFNRIFGVHIDGKILIRFKKINNDFTTSNIQTKQTVDFEKQYEIEGLPGKSTFLYAGYLPDATWTNIKNIYLLCKKGGNLVWQKDLTGFAEQTQISFVIPIEEQEETVVSRVKIKTTKKKITNTGT